MPVSLDQEICVPQILFQPRPKSLPLIPRIYPGPPNETEPFLARLSLILGNLIGLAPNWRLGVPQDLVLWYHSTILKNEISPYKSPPHLSENTRLQTAERFERDDLAFFRRPARSSAYLLCRGLHLLAPGWGISFNCALLVWACGRRFEIPLQMVSARSCETRPAPRLAPPLKESR